MSRIGVVVLVATITVTIAVTGCSGSDDPVGESGDPSASSGSASDRFPTIVAADATFDDGSETWTFDVTVSSPYDSAERYADGWRIIGPNDAVYGVHDLAHDHAGEQPFTRRQSRVAIPAEVDAVTIEGRDLDNGFGGPTLTIDLDRTTP